MNILLGTPKLKRMFKHVYNSLREEGYLDEDAVRIAAAVVNRYRAEEGLLVDDPGGPRRYGWWPGKDARVRRERKRRRAKKKT